MGSRKRRKQKPRENSKLGWSEEDIDFLRSKWGESSIPQIARVLKRTEDAIILKARRLELGPFLLSSGYVSLNQLLIGLMGTNSSYSYKMKSWVEERGLPVRGIKVRGNNFRAVDIEEFWEWAEKNRDFLDFSRLEPLMLGREPEWVKKQRFHDVREKSLAKKTPWTKYEDDKLKHFLKEFRYTYEDLSRELSRSCGAIQRRICDLGLKERPVKADNHTPWTADEVKKLGRDILDGKGYSLISLDIGKSEKAIRGKVYMMYGTEVLDKARETIKKEGLGKDALYDRREVSEALKEIQKNKNLEIQYIAEATGIHKNQLYTYIKKGALPNAKNTQILLEFLTKEWEK